MFLFCSTQLQPLVALRAFRSLCSQVTFEDSLLLNSQLKMSLFTVQPNAVMTSEETAPPPPPFLSPFEECNATVNEWGVWPAEFVADPAHDQTFTCATSAAEIESRVRCGESPVNRNCTALVPDSKCVFKWAFATTTAATACSCSCCLLGAEQCEMGIQMFTRIGLIWLRMFSVPLPPCLPECQFQSGLVPSTAPGLIFSETNNTNSMIMDTARPRMMPPCSVLSNAPSSSKKDFCNYNYHHHQHNHHHQYSTSPINQPTFDHASPSLFTSEHSEYSPAGIYSPNSATSSLPSTSPFPSSTSPYTIEKLHSEIPFLDSLIAEVRQEMVIEEVAVPSPSTSSDISSVSRKSSSSTSSSLRDVFVTPGQTLVIRGDDGQEYKVIVERVEGSEVSSSPVAAKRKSSEDSLIAPKRPRAAPVSLVNLSDDEIAERKKQQNRAAALRYRQKLRENRVLSVSAKETLSQRNAYLRDEAERLTKECEVIRRLIFDKLGKNAPAF
ncbi:hypothetical protein B9Z55_019319 [Caenorhabditis nigoni]|uniref:BZIP domain-containing protein n=1 Tax=Caenorhabditis nigoni TaxID=1611254 RepID=A0A2G5THY1_9PELO|nr:hypothetical protein B9Z55_019319 [Caenorhabditis nigoni]